MDDLFAKYFAPFVRAGLQLVAGFLVSRGIFSADEGASFVTEVGAALVLFVSALVWSLWQKAQAAKMVKVALVAPAGTSLAEVKENTPGPVNF